MSCELCASNENVQTITVSSTDLTTELCEKCRGFIESKDYSNTHHWLCLNEAIWHESSAVKVLSYGILQKLRSESWAQGLLEQIYLSDEELSLAKNRLEDESPSQEVITLDSNGTRLLEGDSVTLIKDLDVKGGGFTAKRGTMVKNIRLTNNPEHIEGRVNGVHIVLVAKFLKKA